MPGAPRGGSTRWRRTPPSGPLAQLAEQQTLNLRVHGSIPWRLTTPHIRSAWPRRPLIRPGAPACGLAHRLDSVAAHHSSHPFGLASRPLIRPGAPACGHATGSIPWRLTTNLPRDRRERRRECLRARAARVCRGRFAREGRARHPCGSRGIPEGASGQPTRGARASRACVGPRQSGDQHRRRCSPGGRQAQRRQGPSVARQWSARRPSSQVRNQQNGSDEGIAIVDRFLEPRSVTPLPAGPSRLTIGRIPSAGLRRSRRYRRAARSSPARPRRPPPPPPGWDCRRRRRCPGAPPSRG